MSKDSWSASSSQVQWEMLEQTHRSWLACQERQVGPYIGLTPRDRVRGVKVGGGTYLDPVSCHYSN